MFAGCLIGFWGKLAVTFFGLNRIKFICFRSWFIGFDSALKISLSKYHVYVLNCQFLWWFGCSGFQRLSRFSIWVLIKFSGLRLFFAPPKGGFLNPISTNCVKRLTSNSSGLLTLRDFSLNWVLVFTAQWFKLSVLRYQPLNWALCLIK
ncbi:hypothetical protein CRN32_05195 [Vibrio vulnificus]|nr:hypothetical protein CRN32_05195 [Vibrio vulnificus]